MDETYVKVSGQWIYLYRALDWGVTPSLPGTYRDRNAESLRQQSRADRKKLRSTHGGCSAGPSVGSRVQY